MRHATLKQQYESWGESSRRAAVRAGGPAARREYIKCVPDESDQDRWFTAGARVT